MMRLPINVVLAMVLLLTATAPGWAATAPQNSDGLGPFVKAFPHLTFKRPVFLTQPTNPPAHGQDRLYVIVQRGIIYSFPNRPNVTKSDLRTVLDIQHKTTRKGNEQGLLGLAFDPDYPAQPYIYVHYSAEHPLHEVIARFTMNPKTGIADPHSQKIILTVSEPFRNHKGGMVVFGPDGDLYLSFGDGGSGGDPYGNGQNLGVLKGKILRIDVHHQADGKAYAIPSDNPFVGKPGARGEIWAYGLRNPFRFSFDGKTGQLWAGDVGQNKYEEVDLITKGGDYGWNIREGFHPYKHHKRGPNAPKLIDPVIEYPHHVGYCVTGGYVYRGQADPKLDGAYIYGDYVSDQIWMLRYDGHKVTEHKQIAKLPHPASFAVDREHNLYACCFDGHIYKLTGK